MRAHLKLIIIARPSSTSPLASSQTRLQNPPAHQQKRFMTLEAFYLTIRLDEKPISFPKTSSQSVYSIRTQDPSLLKDKLD